MAEDKKPNLKDRLKKTAVVANPPAGGPVAPPASGAVMPPVSGNVQPPISAPISAPDLPPLGGGIPGIPGMPGMSSNVAPPAFVQEQQRADAARARHAAAAADPFGASSMASAGPQEVRLVIDDKAVDDKEVGRGRGGTIVAVLFAAVAAGAGGYMGGGLAETKHQEQQTLSAVTNVRSEVTRLGDVINSIRTHVDAAAEHGNITVARADDDGSGGGAPAAAPTHAPEIDEDLITWFREQPPEPPFSPDVYAGRVGRLRPAVVTKLALVQLQFNEAWRQLGVHARTNVAAVRAAINAASPANSPLRGVVVAFARAPNAAADAPPFAELVTSGPVAGGAIPITGLNVPANQTRTPYATGDITAANITTMAFLLAPNVGIAPQIQATAAAPWVQYRQRISDLKSLVDQLVTTQQQLVEALQPGHNS